MFTLDHTVSELESNPYLAGTYQQRYPVKPLPVRDIPKFRAIDTRDVPQMAIKEPKGSLVRP